MHMNKVVSNHKGDIIICSLNKDSPPCTLLMCLGDFQCISPNQKIYDYKLNGQNCVMLYNVNSNYCEHLLYVKCVI
jgi:hypothetical protein